MGAAQPKIHITLDPEVHRRLRVKVALENTTIQAYVENIIRKSVEDVEIPGEE